MTLYRKILGFIPFVLIMLYSTGMGATMADYISHQSCNAPEKEIVIKYQIDYTKYSLSALSSERI